MKRDIDDGNTSIQSGIRYAEIWLHDCVSLNIRTIEKRVVHESRVARK